MKQLTPECQQAEHFLTLLDDGAETFTFQTFTDAKDRPTPDPLAKVKTGSLRDLMPWLTDLNQRGAGVFVTINETDGCGRKRENITRIRAIWREDDEGKGIPLPLEQHLTVETSPGKHHDYLLTDGAPLDEFEAVQQRMVDDYGSDPNARDRARVLRLPGFYHLKNPDQPHMVRIIHESGGRPYSWERITQAVPAVEARTSPPPRDDQHGSTYPQGARNAALTSWAGTFRRGGMTESELEAALALVNESRCRPPLPEAEVRQIARSVAKYDPADPIEAAGGVEPFDLTTASVADLLDTPAPARRWLITDRVPHGVVGINAGAGGVGKGWATLQLGVSVATGHPWLGMAVGTVGPVFMLSTEDDRDEIHRRLERVTDALRDEVDPLLEDNAEWQQTQANLKKRLFILDRTGDDNRLTTKDKQVTERTNLADRIIATCAQLNEPALVLLDPLARFDGGESSHDNGDATRLIEAAEYIRKATGAMVLLSHHVAKGSIRDADAGQEAVRGATGLVDGARWVALMVTMPQEEAKHYGLTKDQARWYVRFRVVKGNYGPPADGIWLRRTEGGVLEPVELEENKASHTEAKQRRADAEYAENLRRIADLIRKKGPMPKRRIEEEYGGTTNVLRVGQRKVRDAITRAIEEGHLITQPGPDKRGDLVAIAEGDLAGVAA